VPATQLAVTAATTAPAMRPPQFTLCPAAHGTTCKIGSLPAYRARNLVVTDKVRTTAVTGATINLTVRAGAASLSPASASILTSVSQSGQSPVTGGTTPTLPPVSLAPIPNTTISPSALSGLFPVVTPSPSASNLDAKRARRLAGVTETSSALPLDPRLIGGQLAGLAVLAAAIMMVVARLSLRTPQVSSPGSSAPQANPGGDEPGGDQTAS
jgi:hypothetical protein